MKNAALKSNHVPAAPVNRPDAVVCDCGHPIFDGTVIRARCVKVREGLALCRCKEWVKVPVGMRNNGEI